MDDMSAGEYVFGVIALAVLAVGSFFYSKAAWSDQFMVTWQSSIWHAIIYAVLITIATIFVICFMIAVCEYDKGWGLLRDFVAGIIILIIGFAPVVSWASNFHKIDIKDVGVEIPVTDLIKKAEEEGVKVDYPINIVNSFDKLERVFSVQQELVGLPIQLSR